GPIAIIALIFVDYLSRFLGVEVVPRAQQFWSVGLVIGLTLVNVVGVRRGAGLAVVTTMLKVLVLVAVVICGLWLQAENPVAEVAAQAPKPKGDGSWWLVIPGLIPVLFSYGGWQQGTYLAGEVRDPGRNLPRGIIGGVGAVVLLYGLYNLALVLTLSPSDMVATQAPAADAMGRLLGPWAARATGLAVAVSAFGVASVCIMTAPRLYKAMADDGCFFAAVGAVHPRFGTPANAVILQGSISAALILVAGFDGIDYLTTGVVCVDWIFFLLTGISLFILRRRIPDAPRPYRATGYPVLPGLFVVFAAVAVVGSFVDPTMREASIVAVAVVVTGILSYFGFKKKSAPRSSD
ncbi:MAG: APC family permease, partial [Planctomycetes bacterium]|nr:APC family permease [Planctomycetota bacterium]